MYLILLTKILSFSQSQLQQQTCAASVAVRMPLACIMLVYSCLYTTLKVQKQKEFGQCRS